MAGSRQGGEMNSRTTQLFLEDFSRGQIFPGRARKITDADVLSFAALTDDKHPLHYDDAYAKTTRFGRPIVHGLHLMALTALGAAPLSEQLKDSMIAFLEQHARFQKPVFKDDTVRSEFEIEGAEHQPGADWGKLTIRVRLINQRDEIILEGRHVYRIRSRADRPRHRPP
jgi:3-hydroxybutyryl-CoA dehydratase